MLPLGTPPLELLWWMLGRRDRFRVRGDSMTPTLEDGAIVFVDVRAFLVSEPRVGDLVIARHPYRTGVRIVKRVTALSGDRATLRGDNPAGSTDSASFGDVPLSHLEGRVTGRFPRRLSR